jgi:hypothetical protein
VRRRCFMGRMGVVLLWYDEISGVGDGAWVTLTGV